MRRKPVGRWRLTCDQVPSDKKRVAAFGPGHPLRAERAALRRDRGGIRDSSSRRCEAPSASPREQRESDPPRRAARQRPVRCSIYLKTRNLTGGEVPKF